MKRYKVQLGLSHGPWPPLIFLVLALAIIIIGGILKSNAQTSEEWPDEYYIISGKKALFWEQGKPFDPNYFQKVEVDEKGYLKIVEE